MMPADTPRSLEQRMESFLRRAALLATLVRSCRWLALWALAWGAVVLVARAGFGLEGRWPAWGLLGVLPIVAAAGSMAWRGRPSRERVRALFDHHQAHRGLLMTAGERKLGAWSERLSQAAPHGDPTIRWRDRRVPTRLALAVGFALAAVLFPIPRPAATPRPLAIEERAREIEEKIDRLAEEELLDERLRRDLEQDLAKVAEEATAEAPARAWETLDHLDDSLFREALRGAGEVAEEGRRLAALDAVAEALGEEGLDPELRRGALSELRAMSAEAAAENRLLGDRLARELAEAAAALGGEGAGERFDRLRAALGEGLGELGDTLDRLRQAGLIELETLQRSERLLEKRNDASLIRFLRENKSPQSAKVCQGNGNGRGGVQRGPGHAPLGLDNDPDPEGIELTAERLDPAGVAALEQSRLLGVTLAAPELEGGAPSAGGTLAGATAGSGGAHTRRLLPRHRKAVERYFARTEPDETTDRAQRPEGDSRR